MKVFKYCILISCVLIQLSGCNKSVNIKKQFVESTRQDWIKRGEVIIKFKPQKAKIELINRTWKTGISMVDSLNVKFQVKSIEQIYKSSLDVKDKKLKKIPIADAYRFKFPFAQDVKEIIKGYKKCPDILYVQPKYFREIQAVGGADIITCMGETTYFKGSGTSPESDIVKYAWDFDGDGKYDYESEKSGSATFIYKKPGVYYAIFTVWDGHSIMDADRVKVTVNKGECVPRYDEKTKFLKIRTKSRAPGDCIINRYAVMINGGSEARFWNDVTFMYSTLIEDYNLTPETIYLLNYDGNNPDGENPDNMIDYAATKDNLNTVFEQLADIADGDDQVFIWVTDHGNGYSGPLDHEGRTYGYLAGYASVDPGDEKDYLESDFKLRSLCTYGDYADPSFNHGMDVLKVQYGYVSSQGCYQMFRNKFVSRFTNIDFESSGIQSDNDVFIERLVDYLLGDTDRDGYIETAQGEVFDFDGDGNPPYDPSTNTFDEDDWGGWDFYEDNFNHINSSCPGNNYIIFDHNFDNRVDIDINYDINNLEVDGTDLDNLGLFDGIDANDDGDMNDWISIDEKISLYRDDLLDDELAVLIDLLDVNTLSIFMEQCFSGGFVDDLSATGRTISTATIEEAVSYGNLFVENFTSALHGATADGVPVNADEDNNEKTSMKEAFNYAAENDYFDETPQYDDNGDGLSHEFPIPSAGDGTMGSWAYIEPAEKVKVMLVLDRSGSMGGYASTESSTRKIDVLKNAADQFINIMKPNACDQLGIIQFNQDVVPFDVSYEADLADLTSNRATLLRETTVQSINEGGRTSIGDGLDEAHRQLTQPSANPDHNKVILLVTDGKENEPKWILETTNDLIDSKVCVNSIGLGYGTGIDQAKLYDLSADTHGIFFNTTEDLEIHKFFIETLAGAVDWNVIVDPIGHLTHDEVFTIPVVISNYHSGVTFTVYWDDVDKAIDLEILTPSGKLITPATKNEKIRYGRNSRYSFYQCEFPLSDDLGSQWAGKWKMRIKGTNRIPANQSVRYAFSALAEGGTNLIVHFDNPLHLTGDSVFIKAQLMERNKALKDAKIAVYCNAPADGIGNILSRNKVSPDELKRHRNISGDTLTLTDAKIKIITERTKKDIFQRSKSKFNLFDDGKHGDGTPGDGVYANNFTHTHVPGLYTFRFVASGILTGEKLATTCELTKTVYNEVNIDPKFSAIDFRLLEQGKDSSIFSLTITPRDRYGNYLGPAHSVKANILSLKGSRFIILNDNIDGTYTGKLSIDRSEIKADAKLNIEIDGKEFLAVNRFPSFDKKDK